MNNIIKIEPIYSATDIEFLSSIKEYINDNIFCNNFLSNYQTYEIKIREYTKPLYFDNIIYIFNKIVLPNNLEVSPLTNALKENTSWKFNISDIEILNYLKKFIEDCPKLIDNYDTCIVFPSIFNINNKFMYAMAELLNNKNTIYNKFHIRDKETIWEDIDINKIKDYYNGNENKYHQTMTIINEGFSKMNNNFEADKIPFEYMKFIHYCPGVLGNDEIENFVSLLSNKNILILDDLSLDGNCSYWCEYLKEIFNPKNITILTLFKN